jgi:ribonuclease P protein component
MRSAPPQSRALRNAEVVDAGRARPYKPPSRPDARWRAGLSHDLKTAETHRPVGSRSSCCEAHVSAVKTRPQAPAWFPRPHGNGRRPQSAGRAPRQGPQAPVRLSAGPTAGVPSMPALTPAPIDSPSPSRSARKPNRLTRRAEFLRAAAKGKKAAVGGVVLQALVREDQGPLRLGFTVTKKVGNAVVRNRTRRRLKEAVRLALQETTVRDADIVLIGRDSTRHRDFKALQADIKRALDRVGLI